MGGGGGWSEEQSIMNLSLLVVELYIHYLESK